MTPLEALQEAVKLGGGTPATLAKGIGGKVLRQHIENWLRNGRGVPAAHCPAVERATGIRCEELRPDVEWSVLRKKKRAKAAAV